MSFSFRSFITSVRLLLVAAAATTTVAVTTQTSSAQVYHPFAEPMQFDSDYQWFAPVTVDDVAELSEKQRANTGWFVTYDRIRQGLNRSDAEPEDSRFDFGWGNRFDFGFMADNDHGWLFSASNLNGPHAYNDLFQNRLNLIDNTDTLDVTNPLFPAAWRNDPILRERVYILRDSLNVASLTNFEASKTWRMEPYRYGGILEPMIGLRFSGLNDHAQNDTYSSFALVDATGAVIANQEVLVRDIVTTKNQMLLGQIGWHYTKYSNRWTLTNDFKVFAGQNFQTQHTGIYQFTTTYPNPVAIGGSPISGDDTAGTTFTGRNNSEFVVGMDVRAEAAYQVTRSFSVRAGAMLTYFGRGIWRGATLTEGGNQFLNSQDAIMPGFSFGMTLNR